MTVTTPPVPDTNHPATSVETVIRLRPEQVGQHPDNIRDAGRDIPALAASIQEVGVLVPLIVVPAHTIDGDWPTDVTHIAVDGNRRAAAAAQVGADLPCLVRDNTTTARETATVMAVTGLARDGLTGAEQAHAVQTMLDLGLSQAAIGRATGMKPTTVKTAKTAATLTGDAADQANTHDLTLDQLATLADYQTDDTAVALLIGAAQRGPGTFDHAVARLRQDRETRARTQALLDDLTARGIPVTEHRPSSHTTPTRLDALADTDGQLLTEDTHHQCPGRAAYVTTDYTGETVAVHCCTDPDNNGHVALYAPIPGTNNGTGQPGGPMTDEQKAERRELIRRNKEMLAAQEVRLDFITRTVTTKKHAKTIAAWALAQVIGRDRTYARWVSTWGEPKTLARILGATDPDQHCRDAAPTRHGALLWAQLCAAYETEFTKDAWRRTDPHRAAYLRHLVSLGYTPCDTEQLMITAADTDHPQDD